MAATIEIPDEQTRQILYRAAWDTAVASLAAFDDACFAGCADSDREYRRCRREAIERIRGFEEMSGLADRLGEVQIGDRVEIPDRLIEGLRDTVMTTTDAVENRGWSPEYQERLEWLYPAAMRVGAALGLAEVTA
jgi:hypothetical protein